MSSELVSAEWLLSRLGRPGIVVLDATVWLSHPLSDGDFRATSGWQSWSDRHIPTSRHADLIADFADPTGTTHFARPDPADLARRIAEYGIGAEDTVVAYDCDGGIWAARLWWMLRAVGVRVRVLDGGWSQWVAIGGPVANGDDSQQHSTISREVLVAGRDSHAWVELDEVERVMTGDLDGMLVCALGAQAFAGTTPTRYARRGHIPGSINVPARGLVDDQYRLLPPTLLQQRLAPLLRDRRPALIYCGGGISATLLALALTELGRSDVRVYDGSLDEWTADPRRPISATFAGRSTETT